MVEISLDKAIVYDIETMKNLFVFCAVDYATKKRKHFVFYDAPEYADQPLKLYNFLKSCVRNKYCMIGFNNLSFDSQVMHLFYEWCSRKQDPLHEFSIDYIITQLYQKAQERINSQDSFNNYEGVVPEYKLFAPQVDLYKQQHYDRPQKRTSLKWLEFTMRMPNIKEMPLKHNANVQPQEVELITDYCWNDVDSTLEFFERMKVQTELRIELGREYKLHLINSSEPSMVRDIFGKFLCEQMKISYKELKQLQTPRETVALRDVVFPYVAFQTPLFKKALDAVNAAIVNTAKDYKAPNKKEDASKFTYSLNFGGMDVDLGLGGIHACNKSGVYEPADDEVCEDADGTSFYPFLSMVNDLKPEHLGQAFLVVYPMMFAERKKYDKKDPRNYIFKIILNSAYGLSKEVNSYLYDPKFTYGITINGQLSLLMLAEALLMSIPNIRFIQMNTDGLTYVYKKQYTERVRKICSWWERTTKINLEYAYYTKMVIADVNNYMAVDTKGNVKKKGLFEIDMFLHKNPSHLIIPKALEQYFINGTPVVDYITAAGNSVYDYCAGFKGKSDFKINLLKNYSGIELTEQQQKVTRFIVSKTTDASGLLVKDYHDGRRISILANKQVIPLNTIVETDASKYPLDYAWYCREAQKIVDQIQPPVTQQTLFE